VNNRARGETPETGAAANEQSLSHSIGRGSAFDRLSSSYRNLEDRRPEALSSLFAQNTRLYAYPMTATNL
jgi:hypothetical protein